jgi:hypothetical protein
MLTPHIQDELNVTLNEATMLGFEFDPKSQRLGLTLSLLALPEGPEPMSEQRVLFIFGNLTRLVVSFRDGAWNNPHAKSEGSQVSQYLSPSLIVVGTAGQGVGMLLFDPSVSPAKVDSVPIVGLFTSISPDRRWIAHQANGVTGVIVQPWPARDRRYLVDPEGTEPRWSLTMSAISRSTGRPV